MKLAKRSIGVASVCAGVLLLLAAELPAAAQNPPRSKDGKKLFSAADMLRIATVSSPCVSPDGGRVAYLVAENHSEKDQPAKHTTQIWMVPSAGPASAARQFTRGEKSASNLAWSPDGKILAFTMDASDEKDAKPQVWFMYADGGEPWQVTKHKSGVHEFQFSPDGKTLLFVAQSPRSDKDEKRSKMKDDAVVVDHDLKMAHLWTWNIATSEEKQLTTDEFTVSDPRWSPDGTHITFTSVPDPRPEDGIFQTAWVMDAASGAKHKLADTKDFTHTARWSPDGKRIAFLSTTDPLHPKVNLFVVDAGGGVANNLTKSFELYAAAPIWSPDSTRIYFSDVDHQVNRIFVADVAAGTVKPVTGMDRVVSLTDISRNGETAVGLVGDAAHPEDVFRSDLSFSSLQKITDQNAWIADYAVAAEEVVKWKSSKDGMEIEGVLTKPVDWDGSRKAPFLLHPHGGPPGTSLLLFSPGEQVMAANGYMVLQPNFRGSVGRGEAFETADSNDWGGGDYQDDMSGVTAMVDRGWADPARLGMFGWSYGGYMSMWTDTHTDRFKAISPGAGMSDLTALYAQSDVHNLLARFYGLKNPWDDAQLYRDHSPIKYVGNVKTPTMILQGQSDTRVPYVAAEEFYRALYDRHIPVEYVLYPRENHGFVEPRHIEDRMQRYLVFFGKYLNNPPITEPQSVVDELSKDLPK